MISDKTDQIRLCPYCGFQGKPLKQVFGAEVYYICPNCSGHMMDPQSLAEAKELNRDMDIGIDSAIPSLELPRLQKPLVTRIFAAEDSKLMLKMLVEGIQQSNIAVFAEGFQTGEDIIMRYTRALKEGKMPDIVILDATLPLLPGTSVAVAIRALERAAGIPTPAPIIFFTVQPITSIKPTMDVVGNAVYMPKYNAEAHDALINRLITVVRTIAEG
ncbi:MAG: hypothetical protein Kow0090_20700 [Myxococcota bacterium]